jgi:hypothetical protein
MRTHQLGARFLLAASSAAIVLAALSGLLSASAASAAKTPIKISVSGRIGTLRLNASTPANVVRHWGPPDYTHTGNIFGPSSPYPDYTLLGYGCSLRGGATFCATNFWISRRTHRLESFSTTSSRFVLFGAVHVGMSATVASRREHEPDVAGCGELIHVTTRHLDVVISTHGGRLGADNRLSGGRVEGIGIDENRLGVGVNFC